MQTSAHPFYTGIRALLTSKLSEVFRGQNIAGQVTLPQLMVYLKADILCCQETKLARKRLTADLAILDDYYTFYSCCRSTTGIISSRTTSFGYSGVLTCVDKRLRVQNAQDGLTGTLKQGSSSLVADDIQSLVVGPSVYDTLDDLLYDLEQLDAEGRCMITDHGLFVLINLYCPNQSETRLAFKLDYHLLIERLVHYLVGKGREIIIVGDINIAHTEIDHCDPAKSIRDNQLVNGFGSHPSRQWMNRLIQPEGPVIDLFRQTWPQRERAYTCWNTLTDARRSNFGTRIDYVLITPSLAPLVKHCDIMPEVYGSDHCPIYVELFSTLPRTVAIPIMQHAIPYFTANQDDNSEIETEEIDTRSLVAVDLNQLLPVCCSVRMDEFSKRQTKVSQFFSVNSSHKQQPPASSLNPAKKLKEKRFTQINSSQSNINTVFTTKTKDFVRLSALSFLKDGSQHVTDELKQSTKQPVVNNIQESNVTVSNDRDLKVLSNLSVEKRDDSAPLTRPTWSALFHKELPKCYHGEPCIQNTVNKSGPNKGRKFWLCSRPVGAESQSTERRTSLAEWHCDYFQWDELRGFKRSTDSTNGAKNRIKKGRK